MHWTLNGGWSVFFCVGEEEHIVDFDVYGCGGGFLFIAVQVII